MYYAPSKMRVNVVRRKGGSAIKRRADKGRGEIPGDEREGRVRKRKRSGGSRSRPSGSEDLCDMRSEGYWLCVAETKEGAGIIGDGGETEDVVDLVDEQHINGNEVERGTGEAASRRDRDGYGVMMWLSSPRSRFDKTTTMTVAAKQTSQRTAMMRRPERQDKTAQSQPGPWADVDDDDGLDAWLWREQARRRHTYDGGTIGAAGIALLRPSSLLQFRIIEAEFALGVRRGATRVARWALMEVALAGVGGSGRPRCG
ncbi:hypothetical protein JOL62DRAFT_558869 [Phyllosticta paracitricarpa]|uniref:Uncharacterized protein n=1 Tax=Phyllosticta paracitricarpa TaxID=2016321 RepID=A0ABR1MYY8_9PEZI